ncbi:MAG: hypothetical protein CL942_08730 [Desulfovibrio sp.]|nr:hypothetical protein [Desulfovibrio sp.]|tara:strand:- start:455 stop:802 length:348 start_codon:yes stop_codon:yes gene_type:complete
MSDTRKPATALLNDLADHLAEKAHKDLNIPRAKAKEFSEDTTAYIADLWGGQILYIPKDMAGRICSRDAKIYADFVGDNHSELARKYGLSFQHIHRIIKKEREKRSVKQHDLPLV